MSEEKKKTPPKSKAKPRPKKESAASKAKAAPPKTEKRKAAKGEGAESGRGRKAPALRREKPEHRTEVEAGSIAPASKGLISAFDFLKKSRRPIASPSISRLAPNVGLRPAPPKEAAPEKPAAQAAKPPQKNEIAAPSAKPNASPAAGSPAAPAPASQASPAAPFKPARAPAPAPAPSRPKPAPQQAKPASQPPSAAQTRPAPAPSAAGTPAPGAAPALRKLQVSTIITVRELAEKMEVRPNDLIKKLMGLGIFASINQRLDPEAASIIAQDYGFELEVASLYQEEELQAQSESQDKPELLKTRPPVVVIMGHVDHGKTTLLDAIRESRVAEGESGGITQHIGAYKVPTPKGEVVFLDTPGHEAFTAMRARGAQVTDIVVIVVAATEGVMPQTVEAIDHAKAAGVPIIVAVNKTDLPGANPQKVRQALSEHGLSPEEWGGKTIYADVSAKKRIGIDHLLEMIGLQAELLELKANPGRPAAATVLEARFDPKRGSVATVLVQNGTLRLGEAFVAGLCHGRVKALVDDRGRRVEQAPPSTPVELLGLVGTPQAGDVLSVVTNERQARDIAEKRKLLNREHLLAHQKHVTLLNLKAQGSKVKELDIILKADVHGSLQALKDSLEGLSTAECRVRIIHAGLGELSQSDVLLASASNAVCLLFHVDAESRAKELAEREGLDVRRYDIIYNLIADVKAALEGLLEPEIVSVTAGKAEVMRIFPAKNSAVAGCAVRDGKMLRAGFARVLRSGQSVYEGKLSSLKRFKDDIKEVEKGLECGLMIEGFMAFKPGDIIECFTKETRIRRLSESGGPK